MWKREQTFHEITNSLNCLLWGMKITLIAQSNGFRIMTPSCFNAASLSATGQETSEGNDGWLVIQSGWHLLLCLYYRLMNESTHAIVLMVSPAVVATAWNHTECWRGIVSFTNSVHFLAKIILKKDYKCKCLHNLLQKAHLRWRFKWKHLFNEAWETGSLPHKLATSFQVWGNSVSRKVEDVRVSICEPELNSSWESYLRFTFCSVVLCRLHFVIQVDFPMKVLHWATSGKKSF